VDSETTTPRRPPGRAASPPVTGPEGRTFGRRTLIIAIVAVGVVMVGIGVGLLLTRSSSKSQSVGFGSGASVSEANAILMCGTTDGILEDPAGQVQPELDIRVAAILKSGLKAGDRFQATMTKLDQEAQLKDTTGTIQSLKELQALCAAPPTPQQ